MPTRSLSIFMTVCVVVLQSGVSARAQDRAAPVAVSPVVSREVAGGQTFVGTVEASRTSRVGSAVDGRVAEFLVREGDRVKADQPLARLLTATIQLELAAAEATHELRKQELAELENGMVPAAIEQARARVKSAEATSRYQQSRLKRVQSLFDRGVLDSDEYDAAVASSSSASESLREAQASLKLVEDYPRAEVLAQARASLAVEQARVDKLRDQLKKHTIKAPFDGFVVAEHTEEGEWIKQGELVAEIAALSPVEVVANVLEDHVAHVRRDAEVRVEIPALRESMFTGSVYRVIPRADVRARTFPVRIRVDNILDGDDPLLKVGMLARVTLATGALRQAVLVPKDALVLGGPRAVVYVFDPQADNADTGTVRPVDVELGVASGSLIQVLGALESGQTVVVRGNERLRPGQAVQIKRRLKPDAQPAAGAAQTTP